MTISNSEALALADDMLDRIDILLEEIEEAVGPEEKAECSECGKRLTYEEIFDGNCLDCDHSVEDRIKL